jgi:YD repeat-containing protein
MCIGNPVNSGTGNKYQREIDYSGAQTNLPGVVRHYNSQAAFTTGSIGVNWRMFGSLGPVSATSIQANRPDHRVFIFTLQNGQWVTDADVQLKLARLTDVAGNTVGWQIVAEDGDVETYNADGNFSSRVNRAGLGYSRTTPSSTSALLTDSMGRTLQLSYGSPNLAALTDPAGNVTSYSYGANNNTALVTYPDGAVRQYHYENTTSPNALTGITDERGVRYATYGYDANGKATLTEHAGGANRHTLSFGSNTTTFTDALGTSRTQTFQIIHGVYRLASQSQPGGSGCGPAAEALTYDANGNVASRTDFNGKKTTYGYDLTRNLEVSRTEGLSNAGAALPETRTLTTTWHPTWRLPVQVNEYAGASASGNPLRRTGTAYDDRGNIVSRSVTDVAAGQTRTWATSYTYSVAVPGLILQKIEDGPRTDVTDTTVTDYYPHDEVCAGAALGTGRDKGCRGQVKRVTNPLGQITQYTRYNAHGQLEEIVDPNGVVTTLTYDLRQRLTSRATAGETTGFQYDPVGQLTRLTQPDGSYIAYTYDGARRLTEVADNLGNRIAYTLDAAGNRTKEEIFDPQGALARTLSRAYDALGRMQTLTGVGNE